MEMPLVVTKSQRIELDEFIEFRDFGQLLRSYGPFIITKRDESYYVGNQVVRSITRVLSFGKRNGYCNIFSNLCTRMSRMDEDEGNHWTHEIRELSSNYSPEKATELLASLQTRFEQIREYNRNACVATLSIRNVKRSSNGAP